MTATTTSTKIRLKKNSRRTVSVRRVESGYIQTELFEETPAEWARVVVETALRLSTPFWFSDLRMWTAHEPPAGKCNWWGCVAPAKLKAAGFVKTKEVRTHMFASRNGGTDSQWTRVSA